MTWTGAFFFALAVYYCYVIGTSFYQLTHPLHGLPEQARDANGVAPLWQQGQRFNLYVFLSPSTLFPAVNLSSLALASKGKHPLYLVLSKEGLEFNETSSSLSLVNDFEVTLNITAHRVEEGSGKQHLPSPEVWGKLQRNASSVYLHVLLVRDRDRDRKQKRTDVIATEAFKTGRALHGRVDMIKYDPIPKSYRQRYLLADLGLIQPDELDSQRASLSPRTIISYWKPEVSVRLVSDWSVYPLDYVPEAIGRQIIQTNTKGNNKGTSGLSYRPPIHADEIGLTSDKYIALNSSVAQLPLKLSYSAMSLQRWLLMQHLEDTLKLQKESLGFGDKDLDDVRRLISDTPLVLLVVTIVASLLHLVFELLSFQSDIEFWRRNKSLAGLSVRGVITDLLSQVIVFLYLVDSDTSPLVTIPAFFSILIQCWKCQRATGLSVGVGDWGLPVVRLTRLAGGAATTAATAATSAADDNSDATPRPDSDVSEGEQQQAERDMLLTKATLEADRLATSHLGLLLLPLVLGFSFRSLVFDKHSSWYSWFIGSLSGLQYSLGFVLMVPQLFINQKLKSVSHLPWNAMIYKALNTFIDDLFAFVVKMPTMQRVACFRDDLVFLVYLYQRWQYRVDTSRPQEK